LAAAVALRHLELLVERDVMANVRDRSSELSKLLDERVAPLPGVSEIRLQGLMGGVVLRSGAHCARRVAAAAVRHGVLLRSLGDLVMVVPPLSVTGEEVERIVDVLESAVAEVVAA
jgi:adenosylmethionine-8-amino-7-oxononanoate aminotransferase